MAVPLLAAAAVIAALGKIISAGANVYQTYESTSNTDTVNRYVRDFSKGYYDENDRYWQQYIARHHLQNRQVLYPYRTGYNYNLTNLYSSQAALNNNELARNMSWFGLLRTGTSVGPSLSRFYGD